MVTSISFDDTNRVDETFTPSMATVVEAANPAPYTGTTAPAGKIPIPAGIFWTESVPPTVTEPLATDTLESGDVAATGTVPEADARTGTEITSTGNPANWPMPPDADEN